MLKMLKNLGYPIPESELMPTTESAKLFALMQEFITEKHDDDGMQADFMELITYFPVSMCERKMSDTLKYLITLYYMFKIPQQTVLSYKELSDQEGQELYKRDKHEFELYLTDKVAQTMEKDDKWDGWFSYEQLGLLFRRSKASIFEAIKEKESQVQRVIHDVLITKQSRLIAMEQLVKEQREKLNLD